MDVLLAPAIEQSEAESSRLCLRLVEKLPPKQNITLIGDYFAAWQQEQLQMPRAWLTTTTQAQRAAEQQLEAARKQAQKKKSSFAHNHHQSRSQPRLASQRKPPLMHYKPAKPSLSSSVRPQPAPLQVARHSRSLESSRPP